MRSSRTVHGCTMIRDPVPTVIPCSTGMYDDTGSSSSSVISDSAWMHDDPGSSSYRHPVQYRDVRRHGIQRPGLVIDRKRIRWITSFAIVKLFRLSPE